MRRQKVKSIVKLQILAYDKCMLRKFKQIEIIIRISICYERNSACTLDVLSKSGKVAIHNCKILYWAYCCNYAVKIKLSLKLLKQQC